MNWYLKKLTPLFVSARYDVIVPSPHVNVILNSCGIPARNRRH